MKKQILSISIVAITILFVHCNSTKQFKNNNVDWINAQASKLYANYETIYNSDSSFVIIKTDNKQSGIPNFRLQFSVYNAAQKKNILERTMDNTTVRWISTHEIETVTQLGFEDKKTGKSTKRNIIIIND